MSEQMDVTKVLMPREATREMTLAGCDCLPSCEHVFGHAGAILTKVYARMVEVAGQPAIAALPGEPVAWKYELAHARTWENGTPVGWADWHWYLTNYEPHVPEGSLRNLTPLYTTPPSNEALVKALGEWVAVRQDLNGMALLGKEKDETDEQRRNREAKWTRLGHAEHALMAAALKSAMEE